MVQRAENSRRQLEEEAEKERGQDREQLKGLTDVARRQRIHERAMIDSSLYENETLNVEMVQAREQEQEEEREMMSEKEIEIEKFVDLAYLRDRETPSSWDIRSLRWGPVAGAAEGGGAKQFYPLNTLALNGHRLAFPAPLHASSNYYDKTWAGDRRMNSTVMVMDWVPSTKKLSDPSPLQHSSASSASSAAEEMEQLRGALGWFGGQAGAETLTRAAARRAVACHLGCQPTQEQMELIFARLDDGGATKGGEKGVVSVAELHAVLRQGLLWRHRPGRHFVALSLAEAETVRRILHLRADRGESLLQPSSGGGSRGGKGGDDDCDQCVIGLRNATSPSFQLLDASEGFQAATASGEAARRRGERGLPRGCAATAVETAAHQCFRFLDGQMFYSEEELASLLFVLGSGSSRQERRLFFSVSLGYRRRLRRKFKQTPLAQVFDSEGPWALLRLHAMLQRVRLHMRKRRQAPAQAFSVLDTNSKGLLTPAELWGGLEHFGLTGLHAADVLSLATMLGAGESGGGAAAQGAGAGGGDVSLQGWTHAFRPRDGDQVAEEGEDGGEGGGPVEEDGGKPVAKGEAELVELRRRLAAKERELEEAEAAREKAYAEREKLRLAEAKAEEEAAGGPNPRMSKQAGALFYDLARPALCRAVKVEGAAAAKAAKAVKDAKEGGAVSAQASSAAAPALECRRDAVQEVWSLVKDNVKKFGQHAAQGVPAEWLKGGSGAEPPLPERPLYSTVLPDEKSSLFIPMPLPKVGEGKATNQFTLTVVLRLQRMPKDKPVGLIELNKSDGGPTQVLLSSKGRVETPQMHQDALDCQRYAQYVDDDEQPAFFSAVVRPNQWCSVSMAVNTDSDTIDFFVNGEKQVFSRVQSDYGSTNSDLAVDGPYSVSLGFSLLGVAGGMEVKAVHFAQHTLKPRQVTALAKRLLPATALWPCLACGFSDNNNALGICACCKIPRYGTK